MTIDGPDAALAGKPQRWVLATRPMFLVASVVPVLLGTAWGVRVAGAFDAIAAILAVAAIMLVNAAVNVFNDVYDDIGGTDPINTGRIYPFTGGSRFIQNGVLTRDAMRTLGLVLLALAGLLGVALAVLKGPVVLLLGLIGAALGLAYSIPPVQLSARGVGELAVGLGVGVLPVMGAAWLQSGVFDGGAFLISLPLSLWVFNILVINEIPDIDADGTTGKRTLPVRWGTEDTRTLYQVTNGLAFLGVAVLVGTDLLPRLALLLPVVLFLAAVWVARPLAAPSRDELSRAIKTTPTIHAAGGLWLTVFAWP